MKVITLPNAQEVLRRLTQAYGEKKLAQEFYPMVAQEIGDRELFGEGVLMALVQSIETYTQGYPAMIKGLLYGYIPMWLDALIDDQEARQGAKELFDRTNEACP